MTACIIGETYYGHETHVVIRSRVIRGKYVYLRAKQTACGIPDDRIMFERAGDTTAISCSRCAEHAT